MQTYSGMPTTKSSVIVKYRRNAPQMRPNSRFQSSLTPISRLRAAFFMPIWFVFRSNPKSARFVRIANALTTQISVGMVINKCRHGGVKTCRIWLVYSHKNK